MAKHPDIQKKAQEEIDTVIGNDRLPEISDRDDLPYIVAILKEVLRWKPILPLSESELLAFFIYDDDQLAVSHSSTEDDEYNGYFIPKGTSVLANAWLVH